MERPELTQIDPTTRAYIEYLESELARYRKPRPSPAMTAEAEAVLPPLVANEEPTTLHLVTISGNGVAKRTLRHLYARQHRGGMGIFDLDTPDDDLPAVLSVAEPGQALLLFTNLARAFRLPVHLISEAPVRGRGQSVVEKFGLASDEKIVAALPDLAKGAVALVSERGFVRYLRHHVFGEYMKPGTLMFDAGKFGALAGACRTPGDAELFVATREGKAIRFAEKLVPAQGGPGLRLDGGDKVVAIASVEEDSAVFLTDADGKGTVRQMTGFAANKSAGGSGKIAMKTDSLVAALTIHPGDDVFMISTLSKLIRFPGDEVPPKDGTVQGVNCMMLRADNVICALTTR